MKLRVFHEYRDSVVGNRILDPEPTPEQPYPDHRTTCFADRDKIDRSQGPWPAVVDV